MLQVHQFEGQSPMQTNVQEGVNPTLPRYLAIKEHLYSDLNGEAVVLNLKNGKYYGLNAVGNSIWGLIQTSKTLGEIESALFEEYEVEPATCRSAAVEFLKKMSDEDLVEIVDGKTS